MSGVEDDNLIRQYQQGNEESFRQLFHKYYPQVYRLFISKGLCREDAEDFTIDVFTRLIKGLKAFRFEKPFQHYLHRIARNRLFDHFRKKTILFSDFDSEVNLADRAAIPDRRVELAEIIALCMQKIKSDLRRAILMAWMEGYKRHQIAELLDVPMGTVHSNLERGRIELKICVEENL
ncbi:sigma-70 family RNA polymerase sigma factor [candidate division KSB1 bacterium]|nr:sigma-70 family RNA polymerase sigma factor [candidate division KSB1 bacterium]